MTKQDIFPERDSFMRGSLVHRDSAAQADEKNGERGDPFAELTVIQSLTEERDALKNDLKVMKAKLSRHEKSNQVLNERLDVMEKMIRSAIGKV